jgi:hypothetical protein
MPTFLKRVPPLSKLKGWDLKRTPAATALTGIVTCNELVAAPTHYWGGRTVPCEEKTCKACLALSPFRWHVYVTAYSKKTKEHFIFECTAQAGEAFDQYFLANGTLRGCAFGATRPKGVKNSKVFIETKAVDLTGFNLPEAPDLVRALCTIWQVPAAPIEGLRDGERAVLPKKNGRALKAMREQPDNAPDPDLVGSDVDLILTKQGV